MGIIRLQALVRGHLVRRQAVVTLRCMRAIIEFQALTRGRMVRLTNGQLLKNRLQQHLWSKLFCLYTSEIWNYIGHEDFVGLSKKKEDNFASRSGPSSGCKD
ncbi:putative IQ motif, EF-hand binding protein [Helianthus annuus]|nr:putative IQ motif, EF-hand binding protein [Helianthus annuus]